MKAKLLRWTLLFVLMLPIIPLFGQAQETNHVADKFDPVQSGAVPVDEVRAQFEATKAKAEPEMHRPNTIWATTSPMAKA